MTACFLYQIFVFGESRKYQDFYIMDWLKSLSFMPDVANSKSLTRNKHELFDHVLAAILKSGKEGVFQTEICREFSLDSRDGSRLAGDLKNSH